MKIEEMEALESTFIYPGDIAELLECSAQDVRTMARQGTLPFEFIRVGDTTKIYRQAFIRRWKELTECL